MDGLIHASRTGVFRRISPATVLALLLIGLGILVRLQDVNRPPVETHAWRQTETAALARNYAEEGYRLFYPTVDRRGLTPGYVESELSIYAFVVALAYGLFGFHEIIARLVTIAAWGVAAGLLFAIGRRAWGSRSGLFALFFFALLSPFGIFLGRAIMGDMTAQMFGLLSIYSMQRWQERGWRGWFWLSATAAALAALSKLPLLYFGMPLVVMVIQREGPQALRRPANWIAALGVLGAVGAWYWHAYQMGKMTGLTFGILGSYGHGVGRWELLVQPGFYRALLFNFRWRVLPGLGLPLALTGMVLPRRSRFEAPLLAWTLAVAFYFLFAGRAVINQDYYTPALLPPAVLWVGKALDVLASWMMGWARSHRWFPKFVAMALATAALFGFAETARQTAASAYQMFVPLETVVQTRLTGLWVQEVIPRGVPIIAVGGAPPEGLYFSHRHSLWFAQSTPPPEDLVRQGWKYLVVFNPYWGRIDIPWLLEVHRKYRLIGGGPWFLAYDIAQEHPVVPQHTFDPPPQWADRVSLLGYDLTPGWPVNSRLHLVLYWRADREIERGYTAFLHVWDPQGQFCGQDNHPPLNGFASHETWEAGRVFADPFQVDISACQDASVLDLAVGFYAPETMERLPLTVRPHEHQLFWFRVHLSDRP